MTLKDRTAVVTGAGSGLGRGIALALAAQGARVAAADIDETTAKETAAMIGKTSGRAIALRADTSRAEDVDGMVTAAVKELGPLEIIVNNAGILDGYFNVDEMSEAVWRRTIDIDLTGVFLGCKRAIAEMLPRGRGRVINMASVAGLNGTGGGAVNCICPGPILTGLRQHSQQILGPDVPDMSGRGVAVNDDQIRGLVPVGRRGTVEDIASAVCYLASDEAGYITGHAMVVDGGWRAK